MLLTYTLNTLAIVFCIYYSATTILDAIEELRNEIKDIKAE